MCIYMKKKLNVLQLSIDYPPASRWGMGYSVFELVHELAKHCAVSVGTRYSNYPSKSNSKNSGLIYSDKFWDINLLINKYQPRDSYVDFELLQSWNLLLANKIISEYTSKHQRPSLVHNHNWQTFETAKIISRHFGCPIVSSIHFMEKQYNKTGNICTQADFKDIVELENQILSLSKKIILFSESSRGLLVEHYGFKDINKTEIIPHGINLNEVSKHTTKILNTKQQNIIFVGRLVPEKGVESVLKAAIFVSKKVPNIKLNIVGDGYLYPYLKSKFSDSFINFTGNISKAELYDLYNQSDILCFPSLTESFGLVTAEAMSFGVAIIASAGKTVANIISNGETGITVNLKYGDVTEIDQDDLNQKLYTILTDNKLRANLQKNARQHALKHFDIKTEVKRVLSVYKDMLSTNER